MSSIFYIFLYLLKLLHIYFLIGKKDCVIFIGLCIFLQVFFYFGYKLINYCLSLLSGDTQDSKTIKVALDYYVNNKVRAFNIFWHKT